MPFPCILSLFLLFSLFFLRWQVFGVESSFPLDSCASTCLRVKSSFPPFYSSLKCFQSRGKAKYIGHYTAFLPDFRLFKYHLSYFIRLNHSADIILCWLHDISFIVYMMWIAVSHQCYGILHEHGTVILNGGIQRYSSPVYDNG